MPLTLEELYALVNERAGLVRERERLVGPLDQRINAIDEIVAASLAKPTPTSGGDARAPRMRTVELYKTRTVPMFSSDNPAAAANALTFGQRLLEIIAESEGAPLNYEDVAARLYGEANEANHRRLRSALSSLSHAEKIKAGPSPRIWLVA